MMTDGSDLTEHHISSETIASGGMLTVKRDQVRLPNGHISQREYVIHPGAVVVVPILPNGNVILEKQFRYPLHQVFIELPAGKIDADEAVLVTGQRELLEETGYTAIEWVKLGHQHPCIGSVSYTHLDVYKRQGLVFIVSGLAFKLGAVPFQMWVPDVYEGSPTAVTMLISSVPKLAAFALVIRLLVQTLPGLAVDWQQMLMIMAVLSRCV